MIPLLIEGEPKLLIAVIAVEKSKGLDWDEAIEVNFAHTLHHDAIAASKDEQ